MIGLRMSPADIEKCKTLAASEERSAASFALLMYRRGLAQYETERAKSPKTRRG